MSVDMGIPTLFPWSKASKHMSSEETSSVDFPLQLVHGVYNVTDICMGNPHAVVFVENMDGFFPSMFLDEGPMLSTYDKIFPNGTNVEFAQVRTGCLSYLCTYE